MRVCSMWFFPIYSVKNALPHCCSYFAKSHVDLQSLIHSCYPTTVTLVTSDHPTLTCYQLSGFCDYRRPCLIMSLMLSYCQGVATCIILDTGNIVLGSPAHHLLTALELLAVHLESCCPLLLESILASEFSFIGFIR